MISVDLTNKTALVTGGASGIGLAVVESFIRNGARVAVNFLPTDRAAAARVAGMAAAGLTVLPAPADVAQPAMAQAMVAKAIDELGSLDFLINNAGAAGTREPIPFPDLHAITDELWQTVLSTNLIAPFTCVRAAEKALRASRGAVVNTASISGFGVRGSSIPYAASKAGLINLTRSLARALAPDVRVNAVAPGLVETPWTEPWSAQRKQATRERTLLRRLAQPEDIAEAILYLAAGAGYMTGQTLILDGGLE
jgi:3-oxoacyl-[acyl-carrier protein] reductase